jgi:glycosyltransferase involved in cell wall biosynthesis
LPFNPALSKAKFVMAIDTPMKYDARGRFRQWAGRMKLRRLLGEIDRIIVPGERSWQYARFLGFDESQIRRGVYGFDYERFGPLLERRLSRPGGWPKRFLFAGRYVPQKGIDVLLEAYAIYRRRHVADAWPLTCSGTGPLIDQVRRATEAGGVEDAGFVQPQDQPALWAECGAFVLSSRYEPWGVVVAEACAAGLPVVCTEACGASVELVRSHYNGLTVATGDANDLARGLSVIHAAYDRLPEMGRRGQPLAAAFSADAYADRWAAMFEELVAAS